MSLHKEARTIRPEDKGSNNSNIKRPTCPKCRGILIPDVAFQGDGETRVVLSVGCVNCGERIFREHKRRAPNGKELNAHRLAGRPGHTLIDGRRLS